jgi:hypothetical protein
MQDRYALWAGPDERTYGEAKIPQRLQAAMHVLAHSFQGNYVAPRITLLDNITGSRDVVFDQAEEVAGLLSPFRVELTSIVVEENKVRLMGTGASKAYAIADRVFGQRPQERPTALDLFEDARQSTPLEGVAAMARELIIVPKAFTVKEVRLYVTRGLSSYWEYVDSFPLRSP